MHKIFRNILALILAFNFLASTAGVRLLVHYCFHCEVTEYNVFSDPGHDCCDLEHIHEKVNNSHNACCTDSHTNKENQEHCDDCCETELKYVKNEYKASHEKSVLKLWVPVADIPETLISDCCESCIEEKTFNDYKEPPPEFYSGKDFLIFTHQLKIC